MDKPLFEKMFGISQEYHFVGRLASWLAGMSGKLFMAAYLAGIVFMLFRQDSKLSIYLLFPVMTMMTAYTFRQTIKRGRPYDEYPIKPFMTTKKNHFGMPSNHSASAMIVGMAWLYIGSMWGALLIVLAVLTGISRIFAGIHYPFDVCVGWVLALIYGSLMLYILL